tara:strand:- start:51 stop:374 length:324 start_codon:yes stop_codon:yes gene_type:complete
MVNRTKELRTRGNISSRRSSSTPSSRRRRTSKNGEMRNRPFMIGELVDYKGEDFLVAATRVGVREMEYDIINEDDTILDVPQDELEGIEESSARRIKEARELWSEKF